MKIKVMPGGPDRRVPMEPRLAKPRYFPQGKPTQAERTQYIERRLACGDLVEVKAEEPPVPAAAPATKVAAPAAPAATAKTGD